MNTPSDSDGCPHLSQPRRTAVRPSPVSLWEWVLTQHAPTTTVPSPPRDPARKEHRASPQISPGPQGNSWGVLQQPHTKMTLPIPMAAPRRGAKRHQIKAHTQATAADPGTPPTPQGFPQMSLHFLMARACDQAGRGTCHRPPPPGSGGITICLLLASSSSAPTLSRTPCLPPGLSECL